MRNKLSSPTFVLLAVFPQGAVQGKLTPGSVLRSLDPLHHLRLYPGGVPGLRLVSTAPNPAAFQRGKVSPTLPPTHPDILFLYF